MAAEVGVDRAASPQDVSCAYRVLLGREAEGPAVLEGGAGRPIKDIAVGLIVSDEFTTGVAAPLIDARAPGDRYAGLPTGQDAAWASLSLCITPATAEGLAAAQDWRTFLLALFGDPEFGRAIDALELGWRRDALLDGLEGWEAARPDAGSREDDWGESIAEREASMKRDVAERLRLALPAAAASVADGAPLISVLTPVYDAPLEFLARAIDSVRGQTHGRWELILVDDGSTKSTVRSMLEAYAALDARIRVVLRPANSGIAAASNAGLALAQGGHLALLDHDDMLTRDALEHVAAAIRAAPDVDLIYSDEAFIGEDDQPLELFPKPDWSPLLMLNMHYVSHLTVLRTARVRELGGFPVGIRFLAGLRPGAARRRDRSGGRASGPHPLRVAADRGLGRGGRQGLCPGGQCRSAAGRARPARVGRLRGGAA